MMRTGFGLVVALLVCLAGLGAPALAQQTPAQQSGAPPGGTATPSPSTPRSFLPPPGARPATPPAEQGVSARAYAWLMAVQGDYNQRLARTVRALRTENVVLATLALAGLSFMYGVLHAIGPGHGKAVVSSYVLASNRTVRRGIALSFLAALFQAISALLLVALLVGIFNATGVARRTTEAWLETVSWGLVALIGVWLLVQQARKLWPQRAARDHHGHAHAHGTHAHAHAAGAHAGHAHAGHAHTGHTHAHDPHDGHDHSDCCGHAHMPDPKDLEGAWSWRTAIPLALAIGIRPCTGAIAVLIFSLSQGLIWAGVFATFAMAVGTAITVSALAVLAVGSRDLAARLAGEGHGGWGVHVRTAAGIGGALAVTTLGVLLFVGSLQATNVF
jgi:nickel/cobalt transporter (NicO) family protein